MERNMGESGEVNITKSYVKNDEPSFRILNTRKKKGKNIKLSL
jgi:hypothetical protein